MSEKTAKKMRQLVRRRLREDMMNYFDGIPKLRIKPKWVPKIIWKFFYWVVFARSKAKKLDSDEKV